MAILGIDLGMTNSLAAVWRGGREELIPSAAGGFLTPSAVSIDEDGAILVGKAAQDRLISHPDRSAARFKRFMGTDKVFSLGGSSFGQRSYLPWSSAVCGRMRRPIWASR